MTGSDKNYSLIKVLYERVVFSTRKSGKKRKVWWCRLLIRLDYVRKQTLLPWAMENGFKVTRKKPKCDKLHDDLYTKPQ